MPDTINATGISMSRLANPQEFARTLAAKRAAETGNPTTVILSGGITVTQLPPPRPTNIAQTAAGSPPSTPPASEGRTQASNEGRAQGERGQGNENDEQDGTNSGGSPQNQRFDVFGPIREDGGAVLPSLETILFDVPQQALRTFTSLLPPAFVSLLPIGAVAGLVMKGPVSLTVLAALAGGAALGTVAGQAIRSLSGGVGAVQGLTGSLGAGAISRVTGSSPIPVNINSTFGDATLSRNADGSSALTPAQLELRRLSATVSGQVTEFIGAPNTAEEAASLTPAQRELRRLSATVSRQTTEFIGTPETSAVLANVTGSVGNIALNRNALGIPVSPQSLGLNSSMALNTAGVPTAIPTNVLGLPSSAGLAPLAALLGTTVSGRVPILAGNLSQLPNVGALSGVSQNVSPGLAERLIPANSLANLLPQNLRQQIPAVPPRVRNPGTVNDVEARNQASSVRIPPSELRPAGPPPQTQEPVLTGTDNGRIPYEQKISPKGITLGQLSTRAQFGHNIIPQNGLSVDQIIAGLSWLATNVLDPVFEAYPGWTVTAGFRGPGGSNTTGDHGRGAAVDFKWYSKSRGEHLEICQWIRQRGLPVDLLIYERPGNTVWIHVAGGPNVRPNIRGARLDQTYFGGSTYRPGLIA